VAYNHVQKARRYKVPLGTHSLEGGCKVRGHSVHAEVVPAASRHVLHLPLTPTVLRQVPEFQLLWGGNAQCLRLPMAALCAFYHVQYHVLY